jgi:ribulose-phosphate 3-epimerase
MKKHPYIITASILSANFAKLGQEVDAVLKAGADWIHFDVMDNHYVPNLTIGPMVCQALRDHGVTAPIDVHLMTYHVDKLVEDFAKAGASTIMFHPEASQHVHRSLDKIKQLGCKAGLALNPATPLAMIEEMLPLLDILLVMSVNPGFGGQSFIPLTLDKIHRLRELCIAHNLHPRIAVDGGVHSGNIAEIARCGADTFIAGSAIFKTQDYAETLAEFRQSLAAV